MKTLTQTDTHFIRCPHCKCEYEASEIYMPGQLLGRPNKVIKDPLGKVLYTDWCEDEEPQLVEHFICENCGKPFVVETTLTFKTKPEDEELDFTNQEASLLDK